MTGVGVGGLRILQTCGEKTVWLLQTKRGAMGQQVYNSSVRHILKATGPHHLWWKCAGNLALDTAHVQGVSRENA